MEYELPNRHEFSDFGQKSLVDLLRYRKTVTRKCPQERVARHFFRARFVICDPKRQRINSVAVLVVDLLIIGFVLYLRRSKNSCVCDNALEAACHFRSTSFLPVWGSNTRSVKSGTVTKAIRLPKERSLLWIFEGAGKVLILNYLAKDGA